MKKIIALVLVISVLSAGCSWLKKDPQKAVDEGVSKFADVEKMSLSLSLNGTVRAPEGEKPSKIDFTSTVTGKSDTSDEESPKLDTKFSLSASADTMQASGELLFRLVDKKSFASLAKLEVPGAAGESLKTQLAGILNAWWTPPSDDQEDQVDAFSKELEELQEKFKTTKFFKNATEEGLEEVSGTPSTKYRVELDKEAITKFIIDMARSAENSLTPEEELAIGERLNEMEFAGAVWVGEDNVLHRVKGTLAIQPKQGPSSSFEIDFSGWDYGKDIEIVAPESAQEFNPFMMLPILGALSSISQEQPEPSPEPMGAEQVNQ